jgi:membrane-associated phospholipid phosphatase
VAIGFHFVGDIIGGWLIGLIGFGLLVWLDRPLQQLLEKGARLFRIKNETSAASKF